MTLSDYFVTTDWLADHLEDEGIRIVDASVIFNPAADDPAEVLQSGRPGYEEGHIPGAIHADLFQLNQANADIPFTFTDPQAFADGLADLGLSADDDAIVIYDRLSMVGLEDKCQFWASRLAWQMAQIGWSNFYILDGGFFKWQEEDRPIETGEHSYPALSHQTVDPINLKAEESDVFAAIDKDDTIIMDTLPPEQYQGEVAPFGEEHAGHIPSAINVHYGSLTNNQTGELKDEESLREIFQAANLLDEDQQVISYCGFGVGATWVQYVLNALGQDRVSVYDDSMTGWTNHQQPISR